MYQSNDEKWLKVAAIEAEKAVKNGHGGPFGAVIAKNGAIVARGHNRVLVDRDPTAHAEIVAIRKAAKKLGGFDLGGCEIYSSCEPCPMCLGAIMWARISKLVFGATRLDAAKGGFDDAKFYEAFRDLKAANWLEARFVRNAACQKAFESWAIFGGDRSY